MHKHLNALCFGFLGMLVSWVAPIGFFLFTSPDPVSDFERVFVRKVGSEPMGYDLPFVFQALAIAPIVESLIMAALLSILKVLHTPAALSIGLSVIAGWYVHGATVFTVGQGLAFGVFSLVWLRVRQDSSFVVATYFMALSHSTTNLLILVGKVALHGN